MKLTFDNLEVGTTFDWIDDEFGWIDDVSPYNSFFKRCQKTSRTMYMDSDGQHHVVGSKNVRVFHIGLNTPEILEQVVDSLKSARKDIQSIKNDDWYFTRKGTEAFSIQQKELTEMIDELQACRENIQE